MTKLPTSGPVITGVESADQLIIKDGGALVFSPVATLESTQVLSTNEIKTTIREVKEAYRNKETAYAYIWKNIAVPVSEGIAFTPQGTLALNEWNNDWVGTTDVFTTPFKGYHISVHPTKEDEIKNPTYNFTGKLNGNMDAVLKMYSKGFHLFGNSWSDSSPCRNKVGWHHRAHV